MESIANIEILPTIIFAVVTSFTPGPNNILATSNGALYGYRKSLPFIFGVCCGFLIIMILCATVSTLLNSIFPKLSPVLRIIGAIYILWLAYGVYQSRNKIENSENARPLRFRNGFILQFVNPKAIFYGMTIFSTFLASLLGQSLSVIVVLPFLIIITFSAVSTWALAGNLIRHWLNTQKRRRIFGIILSGALVYTALDILGLFV